MSEVIPNVIIFDIDGTLIGDITPQVMLYDLHNMMKQKNKKINLMNTKQFREKLKNGIVRPYFVKFIKYIRDTMPNTEFFIYTASEKRWATFLVPHIENACGCKFSRPILTRDNCVITEREYKKKVDIIHDCIIKTLRKSYKGLKKHEIEDKIMIIDNNVVYDKDDMKHVVLCNTYSYRKPENIPLYITESIFNAHAQSILEVMSKYLPSIVSARSYEEFQVIFYTYYIKELHFVDIKKDRFFQNLKNLIIHKKITSFSPKVISYINQKRI